MTPHPAGLFRARVGRIGGMKFTIRDLLWLTVVLGLGLALWIERSRNGVARQQLQTLVDVLESADVQAKVTPDYITVTGPDFGLTQAIGDTDPKPVLEGTRVIPSIQPKP